MPRPFQDSPQEQGGLYFRSQVDAFWDLPPPSPSANQVAVLFQRKISWVRK